MTVAAEEFYPLLDERARGILKSRAGLSEARRRGWLVRRALLCSDLIGLSLAFAVSEALCGPSQGSGALPQLGEFLAFLGALPVFAFAAKIYRLYDRDEERTDHSTIDDFAGVFHLVTVGTFCLFVFAKASNWFNPEFWKLFLFWFLAIVGITLCRGVARSYCRTRIEYLQNVIIVGAGDVGQTIAKKLLQHPEYGMNLVGLVDDDPRERKPGLEHLALLGPESDLLELAQALDVERVIVAFSRTEYGQSLDAIRALRDLGIQVDVVPRFFDVLTSGLDQHSVEGIVMYGLPSANLSRSSQLVKRLVDVSLSGVALLLLTPLFLFVSVLIKLDSEGPVFFRQLRAGAGGEEFRIWKFRTMVSDAEDRKSAVAHLNKHLSPGGDPRMFKIEDDPRVTRVGQLLRRFSIDELPQLANVLAGDMSLVGPRPLIPAEHRYVSAGWAVRRLDLRPGITGLWQVLGRDVIGFGEMLRLDYLYVTNWSFGRDIGLMCRTIPVLFRRNNV